MFDSSMWHLSILPCFTNIAFKQSSDAWYLLLPLLKSSQIHHSFLLHLLFLLLRRILPDELYHTFSPHPSLFLQKSAIFSSCYFTLQKYASNIMRRKSVFVTLSWADANLFQISFGETNISWAKPASLTKGVGPDTRARVNSAIIFSSTLPNILSATLIFRVQRASSCRNISNKFVLGTST